MNENVLDEIPSAKMYKLNTIRIVTFFGGILAGGYLMAENYRSLGQTKNAQRAILFTIIGTVALFLTVFIPNIDRIPPILFPFLYTLIISVIARRLQGKQIDEHIQKNGQLFPVGRAVLIVIIGVVVTLAIYVAIFYMADQLGGEV